MAGRTPATVALERAGVPFTLHPYRADPRADSYGAAAAAALAIAPQRLFKTLIATAGDALVCAVVPVSGQLSLKALARALEAKHAELAAPAVAARSSGYVIGGISPIGQRTRIPTVVDASATAFDTVFVSAGRRGLQVELAPADLLRLANARVADIASG